MRILIVDDDISLHRALEKALKEARPLWHPVFAENGQSALNILAEGQVFDTIVVDMVMPIMDGPKLLKQVTKEYPTILRVVMSGRYDSLTTYSMTSCSHLFIEKPFEINDFAELIETAKIEHNHEVKRIIAWREDEEDRKRRFNERLKRLGIDLFD